MKLSLIAAFAGIVAMAAAYAEPHAEPEAYAEADVLAGYEEGFLAARDLYASHAQCALIIAQYAKVADRTGRRDHDTTSASTMHTRYANEKRNPQNLLGLKLVEDVKSTGKYRL
ncbi:hypothetical protein MMC27_003079 [Xylographa pallens]|nr:hypothetical protein [Xylographa pallens]